MLQPRHHASCALCLGVARAGEERGHLDGWALLREQPCAAACTWSAGRAGGCRGAESACAGLRPQVLRATRSRGALWAALRSGHLSTVASISQLLRTALKRTGKAYTPHGVLTAARRIQPGKEGTLGWLLSAG